MGCFILFYFYFLKNTSFSALAHFELKVISFRIGFSLGSSDHFQYFITAEELTQCPFRL